MDSIPKYYIWTSFDENTLLRVIWVVSTFLIAQDHHANEMLETGGIPLAHRYLETIQHTDDDLRNRKPQMAAQCERLVTSKITLRGIISAFPALRNSKFHRVWNSVEWQDGLRKVTSASARRAPFDQTMAHDRERLLGRRSNRAISRCPPRRIFGRVYRVRHKLDLQYKNLVVASSDEEPREVPFSKSSFYLTSCKLQEKTRIKRWRERKNFLFKKLLMRISKWKIMKKLPSFL